MSYTFTHIKHYKRGASLPNGEPRMCIRCGYLGGRRRRAVVIAIMMYTGSDTKMPVAYCEDHIPEMGGNDG